VVLAYRTFRTLRS